MDTLSLYINIKPAELAKKFKISKQAVWKWFRTGRIPANRCCAIEALTRGKVTCHQLRPDVFGPDPVAVSGDCSQKIDRPNMYSPEERAV